MAGKSLQPSHVPPFQAPVNTDSSVERVKEGRQSEGMLESNLYELLETTEEMTATKKAQTLEENKPNEKLCHHVPWEAADQDTC